MADNEIASLEIEILPSDRQSGACQIVADGGSNRRATGTFVTPFDENRVQHAIAALDGRTLGPEHARLFGEELFGAVFRDEILALYRRVSSPSDPVALRLVIHDEAAARIPWELLVDPDEVVPFAARHALSRGFVSAGGARSLTVTGPLRVLVASSSPMGVVPLPSQLEVKDIRAALAAPWWDRRINVEVLEKTTRDSLDDALRTARHGGGRRGPWSARGPIHVLHWIGHGAIDRASGQVSLLFENEHGAPDFVGGTELATLLSGYDIRLIFLNACHSAVPVEIASKSTDTTTFAVTNGLAQSLLDGGVPALIGMHASVKDDRARQLARSFYRSLADGTSIDQALLDARKGIREGSSGRAADIGVPILYLRDGPSQIREVESADPVNKALNRLGPIGTAIRSLTKQTAGVIFALAVAAVLGAVAVFLAGPRQLKGEFDIAVSLFQTEGGGGTASETAESLSNSLYESLRTELADLGDLRIEMMGPAEAGHISGTTADERARNASELAGKTDAEMVIYGSLDEAGTTLQPEFYIAPSALTGAEELAGAFLLGSPISSNAPAGSTAVGADLRRNLQGRTAALTDFVAGLTWFANGDFDTAEDRFGRAMEDDGWDDRDGKEVVHLFRGSSAALLGRLDDAKAAYELALQLNDGYGRALIGLAEVQYHQSSHLCHPQRIDAAGVRASRDQFRAAMNAPDQPPLSNVPAKAHFGIGRASYCLSQAVKEDSWADARHELEGVIREYESGNSGIRDLAAEAHYFLGKISLPVVGSTDKEPHYRAAADEFRKAAELSRNQGRQAFFRDALGWVMEQLGDEDEARDAYEKAIELAKDEEARRHYQRHLDALRAGLTPPASPGG